MKKMYARLVPFFRKYALFYGLGFICVILADAGQIVMPILLKDVVNGIMDGVGVTGAIVFALVSMLLWALLIAAARFGWRHFIHNASRRIETMLRDKLFFKLTIFEPDFFQNNTTGDLMARVSNDLNSVRMATGMAFVTFMDGVLMMGAILIVLIVLYPQLTVFTILPLPIITLIVLIVMPAAMRGSVKIQEGFGKISERAQEAMAGVATIKAFTKEQFILDEFEKQNSSYIKDNLRVARLWGLFGPIVGLLSGATNLILLFVGGKLVMHGSLTIGDYIAYLSYLGMLIWPMMGLGYMVNLLQRGAAAMDRITAVLDRSPKIVSGKGHSVITDLDLEIRNLYFAWPGTEKNILSGISLKVPAGGSLGIVGPTGSGKSALIGLVLRLYDPPAESIFLGGIDIRDWDLKSLRDKIAIAPQEAFLFSESLAHNIGLGRATANRSEIEHAAHAGALSGDLSVFSQGLETLVGERGITLSGGQKQRTAIARALLKDAPIMVLDDSLSAVDTHTAATLLETLQDQVHRRSLIIVSHRLSVVMNLDQIAVIEKGKISASGTHDELMEIEGYYREVFLLQQSQEADHGE